MITVTSAMRSVAQAGALTLFCASGLTIACSSFSGTPDDSSDGGADGGADGDDIGETGSAADASSEAAPFGPSCGAFTAAPELLADGELSPAHVVADGASVYWARKGAPGLRRKVLGTAGNAVDLAPDAGAVTSVALTNNFVVFNTSAGIQTLDKATPQGAAKNVYAYDSTAPLRAMSGEDVVAARTSLVYRLTTAGQRSSLAEPQLGVFALSYSAPTLAFLAPAEAGIGVYTCSTLGSCGSKPAVPLVTGGNPVSVATDNTYVYWTDDSASGVRRAKLTGGPPEDFMTGVPAPRAIEVDATHVYVAMQQGGIARAPKDGPPCAVIPGSTSITSMSLFGDWVYFTDASSVKRLHK